MARSINYKSGAVIFYEGKDSSDILLLQEGNVELYRFEPDTGKTSSVPIKAGEFFGVKDTLLKTPHKNKAVATSNSTVVLLSFEEFTQMLMNDHSLSMRMLGALSIQLKLIHERLFKKFGAEKETDGEKGMSLVAGGFFRAKEYQLCVDVCERFMSMYPSSKYRDTAKDILKKAWSVVAETPVIHTPSLDNPLKDFMSLDAFERFEKTFPPNQIIFSEFEKSESFFLIRSGVVRSSKCIKGVNRTISLAVPGDFFGLNGFFNEPFRDVTCISTDTVKALEFSHENLDAIISSNPKFAVLLLRLLAKRINDDMRMLKNVSITNLRQRIEDMFIMFDEFGFCEKLQDSSRKIYLTAHDISIWTNIDEEKILAELLELEKREVIQRERNFLIIQNLNEVKHLFAATTKNN